MTVPNVITGRGAFTRAGKDNGSRYYEYIVGKPLDGKSPLWDVNYQAVNLGVKAIQNRINAYGYAPALVADGMFGSKTKAGVIWVQKKLGVGADGVAGPATCKALFRDLINFYSAINNVPPSHVFGMTYLESVFDPGAVGYTTPSDRGLCQINLVAHSYVTVEQAFDPHFALNYTADRLEGARAQFSGKGPELQKDCSIAQHNSPLWAKQWYNAGVAPNEKIQKYVDLVLGAAATYKP